MHDDGNVATKHLVHGERKQQRQRKLVDQIGFIGSQIQQFDRAVTLNAVGKTACFVIDSCAKDLVSALALQRIGNVLEPCTSRICAEIFSAFRGNDS